MRPYYTSDDLINAVKRKMAMPISQVTFSDDDILAFANEELFLAQVPSIMEYHAEYLVFSATIPLVASKNRYDIPDRAIGMKLRDLSFVDSQGNLYEMSDIGADNKAYFQRSTGNTTSIAHFYLESNEIVLVPEVTQSNGASLLATYYLRPNSLVQNDRAAICTNFVKTVTIDNSNLTPGDSLTVGSDVLIADTDFAIGANSNVTASNLNIALNTLNYPATVSMDIVNVRYETQSTTITSSSTGMVVQIGQGVEFSVIPDNISNGSKVDFLQTEGGHKTYKIDQKLGLNSVSGNVINFQTGEVPTNFIVGDYICSSFECIIPQIPSDLHTLLAERTCARILGSLGDLAGLKSANDLITDLEKKQATLIDNRVEGSPKKVFNRHGLLRYGKARGARGSSL